MWFKETIKKSFWDEKIITIERYKAVKIMFIFVGFLFFLNFFFVWAGFHPEIFLKTLPILYITFLFIFCFYTFFYIKRALLKNFSLIFKIFISFLLTIVFLIFLSPLLYEWWLIALNIDYMIPFIEKIKIIINNL